ncbi:hypothetical protein D3C85_1862700 [compost metagenome]
MVRFVNTVSRKVIASTIESLVLVFRIWTNSFRSLIFQATSIRIGAILASGMAEANGANRMRIRNTITP